MKRNRIIYTALVILLIVSYFFANYYTRYNFNKPEGMASNTLPSISNPLQTISDLIFQNMILASIVLIIVGLILIVRSVIRKDPNILLGIAVFLNISIFLVFMQKIGFRLDIWFKNIF